MATVSRFAVLFGLILALVIVGWISWSRHSASTVPGGQDSSQSVANTEANHSDATSDKSRSGLVVSEESETAVITYHLGRKAREEAEKAIKVHIKLLAEPDPNDGLVRLEPGDLIPLAVTAVGDVNLWPIRIVVRATNAVGCRAFYSVMPDSGPESLGLLGGWSADPCDLPLRVYLQGQIRQDAGDTDVIVSPVEVYVWDQWENRPLGSPVGVRVRVPAHLGWANARLLPGGYRVLRNLAVMLPDRTLIGPDGLITLPDGNEVMAEVAPFNLPGGVRVMPDRTVFFPSGQALRPGGNIDQVRPTDKYQPVLVSPEQLGRRDSNPRAQDVNSPSAPRRGVESKGRTTRTRPPIYRRR